MRRILNWQVVLGMILIALSAAVYYIHYIIFRDMHHIMLYLIGDIAFVFLEVFMVTIVVHRLLTFREKKALRKKLNMVIGAFFSEAGIRLIELSSSLDPSRISLSEKLIVTGEWTDKLFKKTYDEVSKYVPSLEYDAAKIEELKEFLLGKRAFLLALLENPNLLEHESFTNLLWAVFHLAEELSRRKNLKIKNDSDNRHIAGDINRVYVQLISGWLNYMAHLKEDYPYLFSLAMRTNPFDENASVEVSK